MWLYIFSLSFFRERRRLVVKHAIHRISLPSQLYNIFPRLMERLPGRHQKVFARIEKLKEFIIKKIQEHQDTLEPGSPRDYIDCFLTRLNQEKDIPTSEFHYNNLVATVLNLYMAGTETTSSTLRFALNVMIKYPEIQGTSQKPV